MTEREWLNCTDPTLMLESLRGTVSDRKLRLFAGACCHRLPPALRGQVRSLQDALDRGAEGGLTATEVEEFSDQIEEGSEQLAWADEIRNNGVEAALTALWHAISACQPVAGASWERGRAAAVNAAQAVAWSLAPSTAGPEWDRCKDQERTAQTALLRDVIGNPFKPSTVNPGWLTADVGSLAQAIYDERAFDRLPILGDALEDGGCTDADILNHCRQPSEHVRGCWVVDLLLGKQ